MGGLLLAWVGTALWYQLPNARWLAYVVPLAGAVVLLWAATRKRALAWLSLGAFFALTIGWWASIQPSNDRQWAPDVSRGVVGQIDGSKVYLRNVRDFDWTTRDDADERWIDMTVDLDQLQSVDFVSTVWASKAIAHTMVSFGFADGQHVVFSAEIRREADEKFSEIGGFFKEFELVLIAATERDIIKLRTDYRKDDVSLYAMTMTPEQRRMLFLSYVDLGNELAYKPRWYQTITTNCTTVIYKLARTVAPGIPMDWRILLSGYTQDYLYDLGVIASDRPLQQIRDDAHITAKAQALPQGVDYSQGIRAPAGA